MARSTVSFGRSVRTLAALSVGLLSSLPTLADDGVGPRLAATVDARQEIAIDLLVDLVEINSGTFHHEGIRAVRDRLVPEYRALGFTTEWIDGADVDRAGHLIAHRAGGGPHVLLIGHLDTVFEVDSPFQSWESLPGNRARGPGVIDMKGGIVVMLEALHALATEGSIDDLELTVVLTGDEERSGRPLEVSRAPLIEAGRAADVALGFEDGDGDPRTAVIARRGAARWTLECRGTAAHSSQIFTEEVGAGAIHEAARILEAFREQLPREQDLTYNPGLIVGGTEASLDPATARGTSYGKNNVVAETATVTGDLRALSPEQLARVHATMERIVAASLPGTSSDLVLDPGYPPMAPTDGNRRLLELYSGASIDLGFGPVGPVDPRRAGAADISFVAADVAMALDGLGLMGTGGHTTEETADLDTLGRQAKRAALLLHRLTTRDLGSL